MMTAQQMLDRMVEESRRDVACFPISARARANLGFALLNAGYWREAVIEFEKSLDIQPTNRPAMMGLEKVAKRNVDRANE